MKKLILALFVMVPMMTVAKEDKGNIYNKPVQCFSTETLLYTIDTQFKESVVFFYPNRLTKGRTEIVLFSNKETGTWTLVELNKSLSCVLAVGENTPS